MDPELRTTLNKLNGSVADLRKEVRERIDSIQTHVDIELTEMRKQFFGSKPPPPHDAPFVKKLSSHDLDIAGTQGAIIAMSSQINQITHRMGAEKKGIAYFFTTREGMRATAAIIAALASLTAAVQSSHSTPSPSPAAPPPQHETPK